MRKLILQLCVFFIILIASSGCSSPHVGTLPIIKDKNSTGEITILTLHGKGLAVGSRIFSSGSPSYKLSLDNEEMRTLRFNEYTKFALAEGNYTVQANCADFIHSLGSGWSIEVDLKRHTNVYLLVGGSGIQCAPLKRISQDEAHKILPQRVYVGMDQ